MGKMTLCSPCPHWYPASYLALQAFRSCHSQVEAMESSLACKQPAQSVRAPFWILWQKLRTSSLCACVRCFSLQEVRVCAGGCPAHAFVCCDLTKHWNGNILQSFPSPWIFLCTLWEVGGGNRWWACTCTAFEEVSRSTLSACCIGLCKACTSRKHTVRIHSACESWCKAALLDRCPLAAILLAHGPLVRTISWPGSVARINV